MSMLVPAEETKVQVRLGLWPAWLALACSLALTFVAWWYTQQNIERQMRMEFDAEVSRVRTDLNTRITGYTQTLRGAAALFAGSGTVSRADWRAYIAGLKLEHGYPAIQAVAFARAVDDADLDALAREMRKSGVADFAVRPPGRRDHYVVNVFAEPYTGLNVKAIGYDMWQDAGRRETMQMAQAAGEPTITRRVTLKIDEKDNPVPAFIMYLPVVRKAGDAVYGYVLSPFRMPALMADIFQQGARGVSLTIHDGADLRPEHLFYSSVGDAAPTAAKFVFSESMTVGGRPWTLTYASQPGLGARTDITRSTQVLVLGGIISALLFSIAWVLATTSDRAVSLAHDMTKSLRESEARFRVLVEQAPDAIIVRDADLDRIVDANAQAEKLFGCSREELLGAGPASFYPPEQFHGRDAAEVVREAGERVLAGEMVSVERIVRSAQGRLVTCDVRMVKLPAADRRLVRASFIDISERKAAADQIERLAFYDPLTDLPNRRLMLDRLGQALTSCARHHRHGALLLIDLDNFKTLNDTLGHNVGDQLLVEVAARIKSCIREGDTVARLGGDEFVVVLEDLDESAAAPMQAEIVAVKIQGKMRKPYLLDLTVNGMQTNMRGYRCTSSIGITVFRDQSVTVDELLQRADTAMYQAKAAGRDTLRFFDPLMQASVTERAALEVDLRKAVEEDQFILHFQPQVDAFSRVIGAEALVRWQHPERGLVPPGDFIQLAEETELILPLGHWVLERACAQLAAWAARPETARLTLAVNVSARQFHHPDFVDKMLDLIDETDADPRLLKLELTESLLLHDVEDIIAKMMALKDVGIGFALDDFGTGYSSLSYLKRLPLDQLKIDRSFVRDVLSDPNDAAIARTIVALAQSLGLAVIAEGVETEAQRDFLATSGCQTYQGYYFSKPLPIDGFEQFIQKV